MDECAQEKMLACIFTSKNGIAGPTAPVEAFDPDVWDKVMQVNLNGTFNVPVWPFPT
jgi:NAD(P)-dependent dehydrogenase (short-subunit alcohol dehydrogenase family)